MSDARAESGPGRHDMAELARRAPWAVRLVQLVLTVLVTWLILRQVGLGLDDLRALGPQWWTPRWDLALVASAVLALGYVISAALWGLMVKEMGGGYLRPVQSVRIFLTANLARYVPGKVWQIAGLALLARRAGVGPVVATGAAVLGQATSLAAATLVGSAALLSASSELRLWGALALGIVVLGVLIASIPPILSKLSSAWLRLAGAKEPEGLHPGVTFAGRWVGWYVLNWFVYAVAFWILAVSFDVNGSVLEIGAAFAAAYVLGYLAVFAPAGIGVRESFLVVFLGPTVGAAPAGAIAIVARLWTTLVEVVAAAIAASLPTSMVGVRDVEAEE